MAKDSTVVPSSLHHWKCPLPSAATMAGEPWVITSGVTTVGIIRCQGGVTDQGRDLSPRLHLSKVLGGRKGKVKQPGRAWELSKPGPLLLLNLRHQTVKYYLMPPFLLPVVLLVFCQQHDLTCPAWPHLPGIPLILSHWLGEGRGAGGDGAHSRPRVPRDFPLQNPSKSSVATGSAKEPQGDEQTKEASFWGQEESDESTSQVSLSLWPGVSTQIATSQAWQNLDGQEEFLPWEDPELSLPFRVALTALPAPFQSSEIILVKLWRSDIRVATGQWEKFPIQRRKTQPFPNE